MAVVVLGAQVRDGYPRPVLARRLERALHIARAQGQRIIVSGAGEAPAMARWLGQRGFTQLLIEDQARSTNENLENSQRLAPGEPLIVVTSNYHVLRTRLWVWHLGIDARVVGATCPPSARRKAIARETLALAHSALRVGWRRLVS
ncbi:YdcF family protein [Corynebacterium tapiri]|uniref:YdcF family protein n=1 Tax=Corynebacterium tapiri TaxID=1448266 RepID=A0A5C4U527_9CORY|nr:YdcF family protein [Corynebacterium tapiri]TNL98435.1 YdcF family protein [Corynebacterium tapiri]